MNNIAKNTHRPWNKGKLVGQKAPLRVRDIWAIRVRLQLADKTRDLALFNLAIDSKLRACDLTKLRVRDIAHGVHVSSRAIVMQQKTQHPVQIEITERAAGPLSASRTGAVFRSVRLASDIGCRQSSRAPGPAHDADTALQFALDCRTARHARAYDVMKIGRARAKFR